ncbi:cysteine proteinase [Plenodomus tracheiphilus IPT5]|uniref:Cysteine proteinase n=1 Tax=Plenodomus tracheiphilus IPT5 TaxID=1408161 RepID=A0A6A7AZD5_9PLEO|nr:cysteine proteinase [Plenodomus tracheiphilus IPT5]
MNGHANGAHGAGADVAKGSDGGSTPQTPGGPYPPIAEIVASASETVESLRHHSIKHLLEQGKNHFHSATVMLSNRAPAAGAYWEYLVAYQIVVDLIPRHPDYYEKIENSRSQTHRDFKIIVKDIKSSEERFVRIKDIIKNDNKRNGALHKSTASLSAPRPDSRNGSTLMRRDDELMLPDVPTSIPSGSLDSVQRKPPVQPKPQSLHGRAVHSSVSSVNGVNDLAQRFANLRGAVPSVDSTSARSSQDLSVKMPSPADYTSSVRPLGPRDMPLHPLPMPPPPPPRLPLNTQFAASLPKEPSPTYSPARNISGPLSINPPRSTPRSMIGTGGRSNSMAASSVSSHAPNTNGTSDSYFPAQDGTRDTTCRRLSVSKSVELEIDASKLYDYFRMYNVLLIDVRDRANFDAGHIYVRNVICIEPLSLRDGDSAEQLLDRLVISPDDEQAMFDRRNEYDVVVYYDESTQGTDFLNRHDCTEAQLALKRLFDTLYEFNADKPLKRPPVFLKGGLDAWVDLVGSQALRMSSTAGLGPGIGQRSQAIRRSPAASHIAKSNLQKRRRREYVPMDPEEEQQWLEEARKGRAAVDIPAANEEAGEEVESPFYRSTEEFLRRYPDVEAEQSMMYPSTKFQSTNQYVAPAIPIAPSRPPPSVPRVSYSGVHERQVSQSRNQQASAHLSHSRYINVKLHRTGLLNFGVTCYMNSVVQCLSGTLSLSDLFLTQRYQRDLQRDNWKGTKGILPEAYATLLSNLYKGDVGCVRPSTFRRICGHFNSQWGVDEQQDAKEFLEFVLDYMHEDLNITWNKSPLKPLSDQQELQREQFPRQYAAKIEWGRYQHRDMSVIGGMFAGQHASRLTCQTCGITSTTYEAFWSISVEIPRDGQCDVRDCLRSYCAPERLAGDEVWRCPRCKKDREAVKKITITRAPETLVIHFKRFSASRTESARKVRTPVHFPLQGLDMGPFVEPPMTPAQEAYITQNARDGPAQLASVKADPTMNGPYIYNAYAVIWHIGATLGSGHYTAFVKDKSRGSWRSFNDDKITDFDPGNLPSNSRLQNEKAYIVFYEREQVAGGASF